jgi:4-coumarate--CoA ligase
MTIFTSPYPDVPTTDLSITERVFQGLENRVEEVVLTDGPSGRTMTAGDFIEQVKSMAGGLTAAGFGAGHTVAIMAPNIPEYCVVFHAVAWGGGTITTLNPTYTANEVAHQLADAGAELLITIPDFMETATEGAGDIPVIAIGTPEYAALFGNPIAEQVPVDLDSFTVVLP